MRLGFSWGTASQESSGIAWKSLEDFAHLYFGGTATVPSQKL